MRILITGVAGFVGSSISRMLLNGYYNRDIEIIGIDNYSFGYKERIADLANEIEFVEMDVKDLPKSDIGTVDLIIHCAAIAPLPDNQKDLYRCFEQNIAMCGAVADFATIYGCENIIFFSSGAVYEGSGDRLCSENDKLETALAYPTSKLLAEKLWCAISKSYGIKVVSIRLFNLYGPHQDYFRKQPPLLGYLLKNIIQKNRIVLFASQEAKRDYIYIDDLYSLIECIIRKFPDIEEGNSVIVNAGSGVVYSVYDIVQCLESLIEAEIQYERGDKTDFWNKYPELFDRVHPFTKDLLIAEVDKKSIADISYAKKYFGWSPKISMEVGLGRCLDYAYKNIK
jgi:nucleoside-diphosphate-sugar epimerase